MFSTFYVGKKICFLKKSTSHRFRGFPLPFSSKAVVLLKNRVITMATTSNFCQNCLALKEREC